MGRFRTPPTDVVFPSGPSEGATQTHIPYAGPAIGQFTPTNPSASLEKTPFSRRRAVSLKLFGQPAGEDEAMRNTTMNLNSMISMIANFGRNGMGMVVTGHQPQHQCAPSCATCAPRTYLRAGQRPSCDLSQQVKACDERECSSARALTRRGGPATLTGGYIAGALAPLAVRLTALIRLSWLKPAPRPSSRFLAIAVPTAAACSASC